jgi:glycosyltransferase involved in cell wall biosynthesis
MLNTFDIQGGAAIATYRLHRGLRLIGVNSHMQVQRKTTDDPNVIGPLTKWDNILSTLRPYDRVVTHLYRNHQKAPFSSAWLPDGLFSKVAKLDPDIVHLFWVGGGFLRIETLKKFKQPIVWTLHDMWPFTGGCHYDGECGRFQQSCGNCPVLQSKQERDLSRWVWKRKQRSWEGLPMVVVATSHWLADMARSSSIFRNQRVEVIPNGIDTEKYKPINKEVARATYNLPQDKHLILFSAFSAVSDKRKGNQFLVHALEIMSQAGWGSKIELVVIGASRPENPPDMGMKVHYMGHLHDEISQVLLYSAADVVVAPSMQENLSNTVMESLACGTPVVAFNIGGMPDMIDHQINGYLATPFEPNDLANGIQWVLEDKSRYDIISLRARQKVEECYALKAVAKRYLALYQSILN